MCVSPISVSEADPLFRLWSLGLTLGEPGFDWAALGAIDLGGLDGVDGAVAAAVAAHLASAAALAAGDPALAADRSAVLEAAWDRVEAKLAAAPAALAPQSHAFHMRLAARHGDFYRAVQARDLAQWLNAARFRSRFLSAAAQFDLGKAGEALARARHLSDDWRARISPRLPGLAVIERRAADWAEKDNRADQAQLFAGRAALLSGRSAPYAEDGPEVWATPRSVETALRFAVAATPVEWGARKTG